MPSFPIGNGSIPRPAGENPLSLYFLEGLEFFPFDTLSVSGKKFQFPGNPVDFLFFAGFFDYFLHFGLIFFPGRDKIEDVSLSPGGNTDNGGTYQDE